MMFPEHRMAQLLTHASTAAIRNCQYHNTSQWPSLYTDHVCDRDDFPLDTVCELDKHTDEVWFIQFSNDGTRLATASRDSLVVIYETQSFTILHILSGYKGAIGYVAWSPDDTKLVTCSQVTHPPNRAAPTSRDHTAQVWDTEVCTSLQYHQTENSN